MYQTILAEERITTANNNNNNLFLFQDFPTGFPFPGFSGQKVAISMGVLATCPVSPLQYDWNPKKKNITWETLPSEITSPSSDSPQSIYPTALFRSSQFSIVFVCVCVCVCV